MRTQSLLTFALSLFAMLAFSPAVIAGHSEDILEIGNQWRVQHRTPDAVVEFPDIIGSPMLQGERVVDKDYYYGEEIESNGHTYTRLYADITSYFEASNDPSDVRELDYISERLQGALRYEGDRVYFWDGLSTNEQLLYNFSMQVDDHVPTSIINPDGDLVVQSIDYVPVGGVPMQRYTVGTATQPAVGQIIHGLGNSHGILEPLKNGITVSNLICFGVDGSTYFPAGSSACGPEYTLTPVEERMLTAPSVPVISITPNPLGTVGGYEGKLVVENPTRRGFHYTVTDLQGRRVSAGTGQTSTPLPISMSALQPGVYFVRIHLDGQNEQPQPMKWLLL